MKYTEHPTVGVIARVAQLLLKLPAGARVVVTRGKHSARTYVQPTESLPLGSIQIGVYTLESKLTDIIRDLEK